MKKLAVEIARENLNLVMSEGELSASRHEPLTVSGFDHFFERFVTMDECWVPFFDPPTKKESMQWLASGSTPPTKAHATRSVGKVMITVWWDWQGPVHIDFLPPHNTINSEYTRRQLDIVKHKIIEKRRGIFQKGVYSPSDEQLLFSGIRLLWDNARPHTAHLTHSRARLPVVAPSAIPA
jgi:hypothetical protein